MKFLKRFEVWLIIMAVVASLVISCSGCSPRRTEPGPDKDPKPSRVISRYAIPTFSLGERAMATEFRMSNGNICVYIATGYSGVLDCAPPLPPLNYEDLPPAEGEQQ